MLMLTLKPEFRIVTKNYYYSPPRMQLDKFPILLVSFLLQTKDNYKMRILKTNKQFFDFSVRKMENKMFPCNQMSVWS